MSEIIKAGRTSVFRYVGTKIKCRNCRCLFMISEEKDFVYRHNTDKNDNIYEERSNWIVTKCPECKESIWRKTSYIDFGIWFKNLWPFRIFRAIKRVFRRK